MERRNHLFLKLSPIGLTMLWLMLSIPLAAAGEIELREAGFYIDVPDAWSGSGSASSSYLSRQGRAVDEALPGEQAPESEAPHMSISSETRLDHAGALHRLLDIGGIHGANWDYLEIGGWPALQQKYLRLRPQPSGSDPSGSEMVLVVQTVVAADNKLIRMETWMAPDASASEIAEVETIGRSLRAPSQGDPDIVAREIADLKRGHAPGRAASSQPQSSNHSGKQKQSKSAGMQASNGLIPASGVAGGEEGFSVPVSTSGGRDSELEIAVSPDGRDIVIGSNGPWSYSNDGGQTWAAAAGVPSNDPSVAWGQSGGPRGSFYGANIASPSTGVWQSTDGGANWVARTPAYTCPTAGDPACGAAFPDQEHIAADRFNVTAGGDQIYSAWRHLTAAGWGIVCSQDSANTWSTNGYFMPGDFPKPAVGADGFVYVIYLDSGNIMLDKFASCETQPAGQMTNVGGVFPVTIKTNVVPVACPTPGLDRCNRRNTLSGITVAVDDLDSSHIYITYAENTNPGGPGSPDCTVANQNFCNENIIVQDSLDGGETWPNTADRMVVLNSGVTARRFMPWLCTIDGTAWVSWYDRRAALPGGTTQSNNSLTDFYAGSASLDTLGNLQKNGEFQVNDLGTTDAQCEAGFATGTTGSWPSAVDRQRDSDDCSLNFQLGGSCGALSTCTNNLCDNGQGACNVNTDCTVNEGIRCDFSDCGGDGFNNGGACTCTAGNTCNIARGSPKYGDYNGNACAAGRLYMTWASAEAPLGFADATDIDSVFSSEVVCCVPQIQVPAGLNFGEFCGLEEQTETLNVCNTGAENLVVGSITPDAEFAVTDPLAGWPVVISPDFCFPFEVNYSPAAVGDHSGTLVINSNDALNPALEVPVEGSWGEAEVDIFIADSGEFGEVCSGLFKDLNLTIQNNGACDLEIEDVFVSDFNSTDFILPDGSLDGTIIESGNSLLVPVRFAPVAFGPPTPRAAKVNVDSKTQGSADQPTLFVDVEGTVPPPDLQVAIADSGNFGPVCKNEFADLDLTLFNQGRCDLTITAINSFKNDVLLPDDLDISDLNPLILSHDADFILPLRYAPDACDVDAPWNSSIQIVSDDPDGSPTVIGISGSAPCPNLVIDPGSFTEAFAFPATVVDTGGSLGCYSERSTNLRNTGACPLTITEITATADDFTVMDPAPAGLPIVLPPGEETLAVTVRFTPQSDADPLAPGDITGTLTVVSDDPDATGEAELCGESVAQSGIRTLLTEVTSGSPVIVEGVDSMRVRSKGKGTPNPIDLQFTDVNSTNSDVCGNSIDWHLNLEILPATQTTGSGGGKSQYQANAKEGNLQDSRTFSLGQCEFSEFQLQITETDDGGGGGSCPLKKKGEACSSAAECCSQKCKGPSGAKTCK